MITINGIDIATLGLGILQGSKEELMKYPTMKAGIRNESRNINGVQSDPRFRKFEPRTFYIKFRLKAETEEDFNIKNDAFLTELVKGKNNTGVNELSILGKTFRLEYMRADSLRYFSVKDCEIMITFDETNPTNR